MSQEKWLKTGKSLTQIVSDFKGKIWFELSKLQINLNWGWLKMPEFLWDLWGNDSPPPHFDLLTLDGAWEGRAKVSEEDGRLRIQKRRLVSKELWHGKPVAAEHQTVVKCVSKVLGHLSKPAAPTSVPGLLRHILQHVRAERHGSDWASLGETVFFQMFIRTKTSEKEWFLATLPVCARF